MLKFSVGAILLLCAMASSQKPQGFEEACSGPEDCQPGECCVLGMQRFSIPNCRKLGQIGDTCRPNNAPENRSLWYPRGIEFASHNTYTLFCPCDAGMTCWDARCQPTKDDFGNALDYQQ
uniref:Prokineticin domain-containing protein n=1 Tax=Ixodes ricinus TaxID=34613 RepID=A0A147BRC8_IXORI